MNRDSAPLGVIAREWLRIGLIGFGGPPAHVSLLRELVVRRKGWMDARAFEDANAACSLLPGPSSTQLVDLLRLSGRGPWGRGDRRPRVRRPGGDHGAGALGALPLLLAAALGAGRRGRGRRRRRGGRGARRERAGRARATTTRWRAMAIGCAGSIYLLAGVAGGDRWSGPTWSWSWWPAGSSSWSVAARFSGAAALSWKPAALLDRRGLVRRHRRPGLDRVQGRRPLVRRAAS